jgi:hypothetical protein
MKEGRKEGRKRKEARDFDARCQSRNFAAPAAEMDRAHLDQKIWTGHFCKLGQSATSMIWGSPFNGSEFAKKKAADKITTRPQVLFTSSYI